MRKPIVKIKARMCKTCIFRPGNLMHLREGRVKEMTEYCDKKDSNVVCHETMNRVERKWCKGSVDRRPGQMVRIIKRLNSMKRRGVLKNG